MHDEFEIVEESVEFRSGFNNAYLLAQYEPGLLKEIVPSLNPSNDYFDGFFSGKEQWEQEHAYEQSHSEEHTAPEQDMALDQEKAGLDELEQLRDEANELDQELDIE